MPAPKILDRSNPEYDAIRHDNARLMENNDCAVVAAAAATGAPYARVHQLMEANGRRPRRGTAMKITRTTLRALGFNLIPVARAEFIDRYPGGHKNATCVTTHHPDRFPKIWQDGNTYLFRTKAHILCVKNGRNLDWTRGKAKRVLEIYQVLPLAENSVTYCVAE